MEKYVLKASGNCKTDDISVGIALKANIGLKFSSKAMNDDAKLVHIKDQLAVRNDKLAKILNSKTFQPLYIDSDSNPEIGTSSNICDDENVQPQSNNEETPNRLLNGNLLENMTSTPVDNQSALNGNMGTHLNLNHHFLSRLRRDLVSPSAAARVRAMKALKSPTNGAYSLFDVPHEEQDIITEEERQEVIPKTIQDVMKDVVVYVETRYGDENRTAGIKGVIAELGAKVNDNFNRNTTHVIFKDGMQSTYNKAKNRNIPIVSILWIEACKKQLRLVDPSKFTIANIERYENPELYKKVKVKKFFQAEPKMIKPKKITATVEKFDPIKIPKKAPDNLTGILNDFHDRLLNNADGIDYFANDSKLAALVNVGTSTAAITGPNSKRTSSTSQSNKSAKSIDRSKLPIPSKRNLSTAITPFKTPINRKTLTPMRSHLENSANSITRITRRTSMLMLMSPSTDSETLVQKDQQAMPGALTDIDNASVNQTKNISEGMEITDVTPSNVKSSTKLLSHGKTLCATTAMDLTNTQSTYSSVQKRRSVIPSRYKDFELSEQSTNVIENSTKTDHKNQLPKSNRRRTLYTTPSHASSSSVLSNSSNVDMPSSSNRRRILFTPTSTVSSQAVVSATKKNDEDKKTATKRRRNLCASSQTSQTPSSSVSNLHHDEQQESTLTKAPTNTTASQMEEIANVDSPNPPGRSDASNKLLPFTPQNRTLFEEYSQRLNFSSTNKRRTIYDVSLHIVEQRLKNINEISSWNRSVSESAVNIDDLERCINERLARSSPQLALLDKGTKEICADNEVEIPAPKKRKLFDPTTYEEQAMNSIAIGNNNNKTSNGSSDRVKRIKSTTPRVNKLKYQRKSILEFQTEPRKPANVHGTTKTDQMKNLAYTNMSKDQVDVIKQAVSKLGKFTIESTVSNRTTHLVTKDTNRTEKLLRAIIRGLWIIDFNWVTSSLSAGVWLYEEKFENRSFSNAVKVSRVQAQAFGPRYKMNLFEDIEPIYISSSCKCKNLKELYKMCGGRVTNRRSAAKYVITDEPVRSVHQLLHSNWILDSITIAECKKPSKYVLKFLEQIDLL